MGEESALVTSDSSHSPASLSKGLGANGDCRKANGSLTGKCSDTNSKNKMLLRKDDGTKCVQNGVADVQLCPKDHICHKCCSSLYGCSSVFYGAPDYIPEKSRSFPKTRSTYKTEAVLNEAGNDTFGNIWLGSYHY